jgi:hypothetical protein
VLPVASSFSCVLNSKFLSLAGILAAAQYLVLLF